METPEDVRAESIHVQFQLKTSAANFMQWVDDYKDWQLPIGTRQEGTKPAIVRVKRGSENDAHVLTILGADLPTDHPEDNLTKPYGAFRFTIENEGKGIYVTAACLENYLAKAFLSLLLKIAEVWPESAVGIAGPAEDAAKRRADGFSQRAGTAALVGLPGAGFTFKEGEAYRRLEVQFRELRKLRLHLIDSTPHQIPLASTETQGSVPIRQLQRRPPGRPVDRETIEAYLIYFAGDKTDEAFQHAFDKWCEMKGISMPSRYDRKAFKKSMNRMCKREANS